MNQNNNFNNGIIPETINNSTNNINIGLIQETGNDFNNVSENKNKFNIWKVLIPVLVFVGVVGVVLGIKLIKKDKKESKQDVVEQKIMDMPIVIKNNEGLYGIFNSEGKKLVDFIYKDIDEYIDNATIAEKPDGTVGIINHKGEVVVEFGKYKRIERTNKLFEVYDSEYNDYLLGVDGKLLYNLDEMGASTVTYIGSDNITVLRSQKYFEVLGVNGKSILKLDRVDSYDDFDLYITDTEEYATLFYNDVSYILNLIDEELVNKVNSSTLHYVNESNSKNLDQYIMTVKGNGGVEAKEFKLMNKDKVVYTTNTCSNMFFSNGSVICAEGYSGRYYLDEKGNKTVEYYLSDNVVLNSGTYITFENKNATFFKDGKNVKKVNCLVGARGVLSGAIADRENEIYAMVDKCTDSDSTLYYYYSNGEKVSDKALSSLTVFDSNGLAKVSEDGKKYYLMNTKGEKVTSDYDLIVFDSPDYTYFNTRNNVYLVKNGEDYKVITPKGKEVLTTRGDVELYFNYFTIEENDNLIYYTLKGKEFYRK